MAASVSDLSVLDRSPKIPVAQKQLAEQPLANISAPPNFPLLTQIETETVSRNTVHTLMMERRKTPDDVSLVSKAKASQEFNINPLLRESYNEFIANNEIALQQFSSSVKDLNDSLNYINALTESFVNTHILNTDLSSITLRNISANGVGNAMQFNSGPQNDETKALLTKTQTNKDTGDKDTQLNGEIYSLVDLITSPLKLAKLIARNSHWIFGLSAFYVISRLIFRFITEKSRQRKSKRKQRKRSIDGFID